MLQGKGRIGLLCVGFVLMAVFCTVALAAPAVPGLYDLDGARFKIATTGTRYSLFGGREYSYKGGWEWEISVQNSDGSVIVHELGTDGEHDFAATYGNGILVWGQASSNEAAEGSTSAICGMAFISGRPGKLKIRGTKDAFVIPPADDYATRMVFKGKQLAVQER